MENYSYNGEFVNFDNVQVAVPLAENKIKLLLKGSAGAGHNQKYDIQHREHILKWPLSVWNAVVDHASHVVTLDEETGKVKIK